VFGLDLGFWRCKSFVELAKILGVWKKDSAGPRSESMFSLDCITPRLPKTRNRLAARHFGDLGFSRQVDWAVPTMQVESGCDRSRLSRLAALLSVAPLFWRNVLWPSETHFCWPTLKPELDTAALPIKRGSPTYCAHKRTMDRGWYQPGQFR
jgi:hypothetical protein